MLFLIVTLGNIGSLYDGWKGGVFMEGIRSMLVTIFSLYHPLTSHYMLNKILVVYSAMSTVFWMYQTFKKEIKDH